MTKPIFIIGSGRTGTHLVGKLIATSNEVTATIEKNEIFRPATRMAIEGFTKQDINKMVKLYNRELRRCKTEFYLDKTHPVIWFAEELMLSFPSAKFVGVKRNAKATIASMLLHKNVRRWHEIWTDFKFPNKFYGNHGYSFSAYSKLSIPQMCALRWKSHMDELERLSSLYPDKILLIEQESLVKNPAHNIKKINDFIELNDSIGDFEMNIDTLSKWKSTLSADTLKEISEVLKVNYEKK